MYQLKDGLKTACKVINIEKNEKNKKTSQEKIIRKNKVDQRKKTHTY